MREVVGRRIRRWITEHPRVVSLFFLVLAMLNVWSSFLIFWQHPLGFADMLRYVLALTSATMAAILLLDVLLTWK